MAVVPSGKACGTVRLAIRAVGGEKALRELERAVEDVGAWYP